MKSIPRNLAIEYLARHDLEQLSTEQRADELFCLSVEDWEEDAGWCTLPAALQTEVLEADIIDPEHVRFDIALMVPLVYQYRGATNSFLLKSVRQLGLDIMGVVGCVEGLVSCPCCGRRTLDGRGDYEICPVCWWEDDGQDNLDADQIRGGPNQGISLTAGRANFLLNGIYDPKRTDLIKKKQPASKYMIGRNFVFDQSDGKIYELGTDWQSSIQAK